MEFALSFDAYALLGDGVIDQSNVVDTIVKKRGYAILQCFNLTGLRVLLFAQQRIWATQGYGEVATSELTRQIVRCIYQRLQR
jgi:hypothetical protein